MFATRATYCTPCRALAAGVCLALLLWLAWAPPAQAAGLEAIATAGPDPLFARFSLSGFFAGFANRTRVVQLCVVTMIVALAILMKKFADVEPGADGPRRPGAGGPESR
jgi:hypothetical protein